MYPERVAGADEPIAGRVAAAGARTVAAGTARLFAAWSEGSPVPEAADQRCEGIADFAARRALVAQAVMFTSGVTAEFIADHQDDDRYGDLQELGEPQQTIYDGANTYLRVGDNWTGFFLGDPGGRRRRHADVVDRRTVGLRGSGRHHAARSRRGRVTA